MKNQVHKNFIKSSNLIFGTVGLGIINFFFSDEILNNGKNLSIAIITLLIISGIGFLVRQGKSWVKYLLLILTIFGLIGVPFIIGNITERPIIGLINILQTIMQIWATILLFMIPKKVDYNLNDDLTAGN